MEELVKLAVPKVLRSIPALDCLDSYRLKSLSSKLQVIITWNLSVLYLADYFKIVIKWKNQMEYLIRFFEKFRIRSLKKFWILKLKKKAKSFLIFLILK